MKTRLVPAFTAALALVCFAQFLRADDTARRTAAVEEMLSAMHADETMNNMLAKQREAIGKLIVASFPKDTSPEASGQAEKMMPKIMETVYKQLTWESLKPDMLQIYVEVFTEQEIKDLTAFYKTPAGQKLVEKTPEISEKSILLMQKRMPGMMAEVQKTVKEMTEQLKPAKEPSASPSPDAK